MIGLTGCPPGPVDATLRAPNTTRTSTSERHCLVGRNTRASPVPDWVPRDLPPACGVYRFLDAAGTPIYIGKSVNLRRRVRSYFYGGGPGDERMREMLRLASGLSHRRAGSDLEAQLEEAEAIAALRPAYNRVHKNRSRGWYVEADWSRPFPRLRVVREPRRARAEYIGPYRGRRVPAEAVALVEKIYRLRTCAGAIRPDPDGSPCLQHGIDQCTAPCVGLAGVDAYRAQVRRAVAALVDGRAAERDAALLRDRLCDAPGVRAEARAVRVEARSVALRRRLAWYDELASYRPALRRLPVDRSRLIVLPGVETGEVVMVPVARGRVLPRTTVDRRRDDWADRALDVCYQVRVEELRAASAFPVEALTLTLIVARWLRSRGRAGGRCADSGRVFDLDSATGDFVVRELASTAADVRR